MTWVSAVVSAIVAAVYFSVILGRLGDVPVTEIAYQRPLLIAIGAVIVLTIVGSIAMGIGTGISAEITGNGSAEDIGRKDERDVRIGRRGELVSYRRGFQPWSDRRRSQTASAPSGSPPTR